MDNKRIDEERFLNIVWDYFVLHANQRTQLLNFYIILESFFITGLLTLFQLDGDYTIYKIFTSTAILFFSFIFYSLDKRTKKMIKYSENAMKKIEAKYFEVYGLDLMIFSTEYDLTNKECEGKRFRPMSYSKLFKLIYIFFALTGLLGIVLSCFYI